MRYVCMYVCQSVRMRVYVYVRKPARKYACWMYVYISVDVYMHACLT